MTPQVLSSVIEAFGVYLVQCAVVATMLLGLATCAASVLRRQSAAVRHRVWALAMLGVLVSPILLPLLPKLGPDWQFLQEPDGRRVASAEAFGAESRATGRVGRGHVVVPSEPVPMERTPIATAGVRGGDYPYGNVPGGVPIAEPAMQGLGGDQLAARGRSEFAAMGGGYAESTAARSEGANDASGGWEFSTRLWIGLVSGWAFGAAIGTGWLVCAIMVGRRIVRSGVPITSPDMLQQRETLRAALGVPTSVRLVCSQATRVPLTMGAVRPCIVLPAGFGKWNGARLRVVLAHELAHVGRRDVLWQVAAAVARVAYWFHPFVWLAAWRMRVLREFACDDAVLEVGERPERYAAHLVDVAAELAGGRQPVQCAAVAMAAGSSVERRVRSLLAAGRRRGKVGRRLGTVLAAVALTLFVAVGTLCPNARSQAGLATESDGTDTAERSPDADDAGNDSASVEAAEGEADSKAQREEQSEEQLVTVRGVVVDAAGEPVPGAEVLGVRYPANDVTTTGPDGRFALSVPRGRLRGLSVIARSDDGRQQSSQQIPYDVTDPDSLEPLELALAPAVVVNVQVDDGDGSPIAGAVTGVVAHHGRYAESMTDEGGRAALRIPRDVAIHSVYALKSGEGLDYRMFFDPQKARNDEPQDEVNLDEPIRLALTGVRPIRVRVLDAETEKPIHDMAVSLWLLKKPGEPDDLNLGALGERALVRTDENGIADFDWIPTWDERTGLTFWPSSDEHVRHRGSYKFESGDGTLTMKLHRLVPLGGQVRLPDGRPAVAIGIRAAGEGHGFDAYREEATTDEEGRYEFLAAPNQIYLVVVDDDEWGAPPHTGFALWPGEPLDGIDFELRPATRVYGQVTLGDERTPVSDQSISIYQYGVGLHELEGVELPNPENHRWAVQPLITYNVRTDAEGRFEFLLGPGQYDIRGPLQNEVQKFEITDEESIEFNFHAERPDKGRLQGRVVVEGSDEPVPGASVYGIYRHGLAGHDLRTTTNESGEFDVERELHRTVIRASSKDGTLAGVVEIGPDDKDVTILIRPLARATGRLIDGVTHEPLPGREIVYGVRVHLGDDDAPWRTSFGGKVHTDGEGRFTLTDLILGQHYYINMTNEDGHSWSRVGEIEPQAAEELVLGDLVLEPPYKPPTLSERVAAAFDKPEPLEERYEAALHDAQLGRLQVLVVFADPAAKLTEQLFHLRYENRDVFGALNDYWLLPVSTAGEGADEAADLARQLGISLDGRELPLLAVMSSNGILLGKADVSAWTGLTDGELVEWRELLERDPAAYDKLDPRPLLGILEDHVLPPLDARQILADALQQAKRENKRVIVQETATWCGPCWRLSRFLNRHREIIGRDYLPIKLDHRWTNWQEVVQGLRDDKPRGIPWTAILDADGNVLATSDGPGGNIGFPSSPEGTEHFLSMLRASSIRLTEEDLATLRQSLEGS